MPRIQSPPTHDVAPTVVVPGSLASVRQAPRKAEGEHSIGVSTNRNLNNRKDNSKSIGYTYEKTAISSAGKVGPVTTKLDYGVMSVGGQFDPKKRLTGVSAGGTALRGQVNYGATSVQGEMGKVEAHADGKVTKRGASFNVGAEATVAEVKVTQHFHLGKAKLDVYGKTGIGWGAEASGSVGAKNKFETKVCAGECVGGGFELSY